MISGKLEVADTQVSGPLQTTGVPLTVADWRAQNDEAIELQTTPTHNAMIYVYKGKVNVAEKTIGRGQLALLTQDEMISLSSLDTSGVLIFSGEPIVEPVVHYGPFVMNSMQEIEQTIADYNNGVFESY